MITERDGDSGAVPFLAEVAATFLAAVEGFVALLGVRSFIVASRARIVFTHSCGGD